MFALYSVGCWLIETYEPVYNKSRRESRIRKEAVIKFSVRGESSTIFPSTDLRWPTRGSLQIAGKFATGALAVGIWASAAEERVWEPADEFRRSVGLGGVEIHQQVERVGKHSLTIEATTNAEATQSGQPARFLWGTLLGKGRLGSTKWRRRPSKEASKEGPVSIPYPGLSSTG